MEYPHRAIRFSTTEDRVGIAFWEIGEGKTIVIVNNWGLSHPELEWTGRSIASFNTGIAERYRLIGFDPPGIGLPKDPPARAGRR